jgi:hypothetical protein
MTTHKDRFTSILENILIILHGLVIVGFFGYQKLSIPLSLALIGRLHPLLLHFPLVMLLFIGALYILPKKHYQHHHELVKKSLLIGLLLCGVTVLAGIFLSKEPDYNFDALQWHLWTGIAVFWIGSLLYLLSNAKQYLATRITASLLILGLLITGHLGASLTHGDDFLLQPLLANSSAKVEQISLEEADVFLHGIQPILENKCVSCHKASKKKGDLRLDELEFILAGGKNGSLFDYENLENSLLLHRIFLPLEDEEHMPPKGKNQLTANELKLLQLWVADSLPFEKKVLDYPKNTEIYNLLSSRFTNKENDYTFAAASPSMVENLNSFYRKIEPLYPGSPALSISFFGKNEFSIDQIKELQKIKEQVVVLNLNQMSLSSEDLKHLKDFKNLEKLYLNFTGIEDLEALKSLSNLKILSISGNNLESGSLSKLKDLKNLKKIYAWNCGLPHDIEKEVEKYLPKVHIELGHKDDGKIYPLNPPKIQYEKSLFKDYVKVELKHPISTAKLYFTIDGSSPDSTNKILYNGALKLEKSGTFRAIATAEGWDKSEEATAIFLKAGIKPDLYRLVSEPHSKYKGDGVENLFDYEKGDLNFSSGKWLGFTDNNLEIIMEFKKPQQIEKIGFSLLTDEASYIFPPLKLEIWVQEDNKGWKLLDSFIPSQPTKVYEKTTTLIELSINRQNISKLKAIAIPVQKLPKWHPGSGQKSWVFIDELVIN